MEHFTVVELKSACQAAMRLDPRGVTPMSWMCAEELRARLAEHEPPPVPKITVVVFPKEASK